MSAPAAQAFIGLMSGTSMDGVDGVLAHIGPQGQWLGVQAHAHEPFNPDVRDALMALNVSGADELHRAALAGQSLSKACARVVAQLLAAQAQRAAVVAIGAHGQTVRHRPDLGYTLQLLAPALLAELTGIDVVADFRSRDVAAGGQGAPLVPIFHQAVFAQPSHAVAVLNIGGMANVSLLPPQGPVQAPEQTPAHAPPPSPQGFDCGPGNVLMDLWCQRQHAQPYDVDGAWARSGQVQPQWLALALAEPYFALPPPKSTGRDLFHTAWLEAWLQACGVPVHQPTPTQAADVQATLCELTALSCVQALSLAADLPTAPRLTRLREVVVCGGGALNSHLMARVRELLARHLLGLGVPGPVHLVDASQRGLPPMQVEAAAFAWLAWACVNRQAGNVPGVTGAQGPRVLGAIYPA